MAHYPRVSKQKKVEFDRLVLSPPRSPSIGVGMLGICIVSFFHDGWRHQTSIEQFQLGWHDNLPMFESYQ